MSKSVREYLQHIRIEITYLETKSAGLKKSDLLADETLQRAFVRSLEIIGEATKHIPDDLRKEYEYIQWRAVAGMRDRLIHSYFGIDYDIVWDVLENHIPVLAEAIDDMLLGEDIA